ncbi:MAG TPA: hypothetical protein VF062_11360 [Candidatus Limnocylindrales bacterium]
MPYDDPICRGLQAQVDQLEQRINLLVDLLEDPELTPAQRGDIRRQIFDLRQRIIAIQDDIEECDRVP